MLKVLTENSVFKNTNIVILKPEGQAVCNECKNKFLLDSFIGQCPKCNSYRFTITGGKELRVKSILIE